MLSKCRSRLGGITIVHHKSHKRPLFGAFLCPGRNKTELNRLISVLPESIFSRVFNRTNHKNFDQYPKPDSQTITQQIAPHECETEYQSTQWHIPDTINPRRVIQLTELNAYRKSERRRSYLPSRPFTKDKGKAEKHHHCPQDIANVKLNE
jgi:hypothetical protein